MTTYINYIENLGTGLGLHPLASSLIVQTIFVVLVAVIAWIINSIARTTLEKTVKNLAARTQTQLDDILVEKKVFARLSRLAPAIVVFLAAPFLFPETPALSILIQRVTSAFMLLLVLFIVDSLLNALTAILQTYSFAKNKPIKSYIQAVKVIVFLLGVVLIITTLLDRSPWVLLSGLGAMTAILLLVFKDAILGFVASIQISALDLVREGDWIEMPKYKADGDVMDVSLTSVKVRNWDKTITVVPTYALISDSFKNWRGMSESGGRRIKRALQIDMQSVKLLDDQLIKRLQKVHVLKDYLKGKIDEVEAYNKKEGIDDSTVINGRRLTNLGTFRAYIKAYLHQHPKIRKDMTFLVRQLNPTPNGIPLEIYVFSGDQDWVNYEEIQADIFDHLLAIIREFDLSVFQAPSGEDFQKLVPRKGKEAA